MRDRGDRRQDPQKMSEAVGPPARGRVVKKEKKEHFCAEPVRKEEAVHASSGKAVGCGKGARIFPVEKEARTQQSEKQTFTFRLAGSPGAIRQEGVKIPRAHPRTTRWELSLDSESWDTSPLLCGTSP